MEICIIQVGDFLKTLLILVYNHKSLELFAYDVDVYANIFISKEDSNINITEKMFKKWFSSIQSKIL